MSKKIVTIFLIIALSLCNLSVISFGKSRTEFELSDEQKAIGTMLGIYNSDEILSEVITRGEFSEKVFKASGNFNINSFDDKEIFSDVPENHDYFKEISVLYDFGIIKGSGGAFMPEEYVTQDDGFIMMLRMLGYKDIKFDVPEVNFALSKGLAKNLILDDGYLTRYDAIVLICNALTADISDLYEYDNEATYLEKVFSLYQIKGIVTDDGFISETGESKLGHGKITVANQTFLNKTDSKDLFGLKISGFYKKDHENGMNVLYYAYKHNSNNISIMRAGADRLTYKDGTYTYYSEENDAEYERTTAKDAVIVYNGKTVGINDVFTKDMLTPADGIVYLYDYNNDRVYDIIRIEAYTTYVVSSVNPDKKIITFKLSDGNLKLKDADSYIIENRLGEEIGLDAIKENSVLSVTKSIDESHIKIIVSDFKVNGKVLSMGKDYFNTSDGGKYCLSNYFKDKNLNVRIGNAYIMYLDFFDEVAFIEADLENSIWETGIVIESGRNGKTMETKYEVKILSVGKEEQIITLAEKVKITPQTATDAVIVDEDTAYLNYIKDYTGLIRYKYNISNELTDIEFPLNEGIVTRETDRLCLIAETSTTSGTLNYYDRVRFRTATNSFGGLCLAGSSTSVIYTPVSDFTTTEEFVFGGTSLLTNGSRYHFKAYSTTPGKKTAKWVIIDNSINSGKAGFKSYVMMVKEIEESFNDKGDISHKLVGYVMGKEVSYALHDSSVLNSVTDMVSSKYGADNPSLSGQVKTFGIEKGDIVVINLINKEVYKMQLLYDAKDNEKGNPGHLLWSDYTSYKNVFSWGGSTSITSSSGLLAVPYYDNIRFGIHGYVYSFEDDIITITNQDLSKQEFDPTAPDVVSYSLTYSTSGATYADFDSPRGLSIAACDASDVRSYKEYGDDCSQCVLIATSGKSSGFYILNY